MIKFVVVFSFMSQIAFSLTLTVEPKSVPAGGTVLLTVRPSTDLEVMHGNVKISLFECPKDRTARCALVGVPAETKAGTQVVMVGKQSISFDVTAGNFRIDELKVDPDLTKPSEADQKLITQDKEEIKRIFSSPIVNSIWKGAFELPGKGAITSRFGNQRTFNGEVKTTHYGVDLRGNHRTPIMATNAGKVVAARRFFLAGNMVIIDHGNQIFSSYAHMSKIDVKVGDDVKKGDRLGFVGATGRVTGPHLHWGTRVNGVPVDPLLFTKTFSQMF